LLPPPTDIYTLSLHDALPIYRIPGLQAYSEAWRFAPVGEVNSFAALCFASLLPSFAGLSFEVAFESLNETGFHLNKELLIQANRSEGTRLNSSHVAISYAVFC